MINVYQQYLSPLLHSLTHHLFGDNIGCRFTPTCSEYAKMSIKKNGILIGSFYSLLRFLRCNPLFKGGIDNIK